MSPIPTRSVSSGRAVQVFAFHWLTILSIRAIIGGSKYYRCFVCSPVLTWRFCSNMPYLYVLGLPRPPARLTTIPPIRCPAFRYISTGVVGFLTLIRQVTAHTKRGDFRTSWYNSFAPSQAPALRVLPGIHNCGAQRVFASILSHVKPGHLQE